MNEELTMINMEIVAKVGEAKSLFIEAIDLAMENNQEEAEICLLYTSPSPRDS